MSDNVVKIKLERYNELIRKETILDELTKDKNVSIYLYNNVTGGLKDGAN